MHREIGRTGIVVHAVGYGEWPLSRESRPDRAQALAVIRRAVEAGVGLIDTADSYALDDGEFGHGERLVREALEGLGRPDTVTVATKVGFRRPGGGWVADGRPQRVRACCDASLARLGVEAITLYQLHTPDPNVPIEESVGAMADLQAAGKVRHVGVSNVDRDQLERARGVATIASVQNECNLWTRDDVESGLIAHCEQAGIAYIPWYPFGGTSGHRRLADEPVLASLAREHAVSPYRVALRWLLSLGENVIPIPGARRVESLLDSVAAAALELDSEDLARI